MFRPIMSRSWFSSRNRASTMSRMMTENGSAVMQRRDDEDVPQGVETADHEQDGAEDGQQQPPDHLRPLVRVEVASSEIMPRANVAESAEVTKNEMMSSTDRIDRGLSRGCWASVPNSTLSVGSEARSAPLIRAEVERVPKVANQMQLKTVGMRMTLSRNCRIERPREMRAMKTPTNGDQAIHHDQEEQADQDDHRDEQEVVPAEALRDHVADRPRGVVEEAS